MKRFLRCLVWVLMAVLPLQGFAEVSARACAMDHGHTSRQRSASASVDPTAMSDCHTQHNHHAAKQSSDKSAKFKFSPCECNHACVGSAMAPPPVQMVAPAFNGHHTSVLNSAFTSAPVSLLDRPPQA